MNLVVNEVRVERNDLFEVMRQLLPDQSFGAVQYRNWEVRGYQRGQGIGRVTSTVVFLENVELNDLDELWRSENLELVVTNYASGLRQQSYPVGWHQLNVVPLDHVRCGGVSDIVCEVHLFCRMGRWERLHELLFFDPPHGYRRDMREVMIPTTVGSLTAAPDRVWSDEAVDEVQWLPGSTMAVEAAGLYPLMGRGVDPGAWVREVCTVLKYRQDERTFFCVRRLNRTEIMGVLDVPNLNWDRVNERDWNLILQSLLKTPNRCRQSVAERISEFLEEIRQERTYYEEETNVVEDGVAMEEAEREVMEEGMMQEGNYDGRGGDPDAVIYSAGEETDNEDDDEGVDD